MEEKVKVTPYEVKGVLTEIEYQRLMGQFGINPLTTSLLNRIKKHTKELHFMLKRGVFFAHRDIDWILNEYEKGNKFFLYTGRGPSGKTHIGHLLPWIFVKWLQDKFNVELLFQMTDDEKFMFKPDLTLEETKKFTEDNILDIIAHGFDSKKTRRLVDTEPSGIL